MSRTFVIGEFGSCHDGDLGRAFKLIQVAKEAGCDVAKGQYWSSSFDLAERRNAWDYYPIYAKYRVPHVWLSWLHLACIANGIEFMMTVYLPKDIEDIAPWVQRFKIASFEANADFIGEHRKYGKPIIVSTGMTGATSVPWRYDGVSYLHCVSSYPCPLDQANLGAIRSFDGYSDHTHNVLTGALAVAAGAKVIEVHFRLDDTEEDNPDYATALSPGQLKDYVHLIRQAEVMIGDGVKKPQPAEQAMMQYRVKA